MHFVQMDYQNLWKRRCHISLSFSYYIGIYLSWIISSTATHPLTRIDQSPLSDLNTRYTQEQDRLRRNPDLPLVNDATENQRIKRYTLFERRWGTPYLTYNISRYSINDRSGLTKEVIDEEIKKSFSVFSKMTNLRFIRIFENCTPDIDIRFEVGEHNCSFPFDGVGGILGHAAYPRKQAYIHFDDDELWVVNKYSKFNFMNTAIHEIGHALGLEHSDVLESAMAPSTSDIEFKLYVDDKNAIKALYSKPESIAKPFSWKLEEAANMSSPLCNERNVSVNAMFHSTNGNAYAILKDDRYVELGPFGPIEGDNCLLRAYSRILPPNIDAAFTDPFKNFTIFFKDDKYWRFRGSQIDEGYPKFIKDSFPRGPEKVDAASLWLGLNGFLYLFQGRTCWVYEKTEFNEYRRHSFLLPESLNAAFDFQGVDAAFNFDAFLYIFRGEYYAKIDPEHHKTIWLSYSPEYPKKIFDGWFSCDPERRKYLEITEESSIRYIATMEEVPAILDDEYKKTIQSRKN